MEVTAGGAGPGIAVRSAGYRMPVRGSEGGGESARSQTAATTADHRPAGRPAVPSAPAPRMWDRMRCFDAQHPPMGQSV